MAESDATISNYFWVDNSIGQHFFFRIDYTQRNYLKSFNLKSPSGIVYSELKYDEETNMAMFKLLQAEVWRYICYLCCVTSNLRFDLQVGKWDFTLTLNNSTADSLAVRVTSQAKSNTTAPITAECYIPGGYQYLKFKYH